MESEKKLPNTVTCRNVKSACSDPLAMAKLAFFASVAAMFEPFLRNCQTAEPMIVFLYDDMTNMLRSVLQWFVKKPLIEAARASATKLSKIDLQCADSIVVYKDVDIGVTAQKALASSKISDLDKLDFRMNWIAFLKATAQNIIEKSPLRYQMVWAVLCLIPSSIV